MYWFLILLKKRITSIDKFLFENYIRATANIQMDSPTQYSEICKMGSGAFLPLRHLWFSTQSIAFLQFTWLCYLTQRALLNVLLRINCSHLIGIIFDRYFSYQHLRKVKIRNKKNEETSNSNSQNNASS